MAVLFFSDDMDAAIKEDALRMVNIISEHVVNEKITAYVVDVPGVMTNEFVIARYYKTIKEKIKFIQIKRQLITR